MFLQNEKDRIGLSWWSDALDLAGLPPGEYTRHERLIVLSEVAKYPAEDCLAGAASPLSTCASNI